MTCPICNQGAITTTHSPSLISIPIETWTGRVLSAVHDCMTKTNHFRCEKGHEWSQEIRWSVQRDMTPTALRAYLGFDDQGGGVDG
jgi:hypothetical protein